MIINQNLIWDYRFTPQEQESEYFKRWYIARVLQRGGVEDIQNIGLESIQEYLPTLNLPKDIREFWIWFFDGRARRST